MLLARQELLDRHPEVAEKVARVWFAGVEQAEADKAAAAKFISTVVPRFRDELGYDGTLAAFDWVKWTDLADNVYFFGLDGKPPAFDRVYNQADGIWIKYPKAEIKERFAPGALRNDRIVRKLWEAEGKQAPPVGSPTSRGRRDRQPGVHQAGDHQLPHRRERPRRRVDAHHELAGGAAARDGARHVHARRGQHRRRGRREQNQVLSERRAKAVVDYLVSRGVERRPHHRQGQRPDNPIASNKTTDGRARNRRTDVLFIPGKS